MSTKVVTPMSLSNDDPCQQRSRPCLQRSCDLCQQTGDNKATHVNKGRATHVNKGRGLTKVVTKGQSPPRVGGKANTIFRRVSFGPARRQNSNTPVVVFLGVNSGWVPRPLYNSHFEWVFELSAGVQMHPGSSPTKKFILSSTRLWDKPLEGDKGDTL